MQNMFFWFVGLNLAVIACAIYYFGAAVLPEDVTNAVLPEAITAAEPAEPPVLVVIVETSAQLERLRRSLPPSRVLTSTQRAFAVDGAVFASDMEAASVPLNALGWAARPFEIVSRERGPTGAGQAAPDAAGVPGAPGATGNLIADLAKKDRLTHAEARALLDHLDGPPPPRRR
jgi:hypothetical protein